MVGLPTSLTAMIAARCERGEVRLAAGFTMTGEMADDVLDHDDRIVDHDAGHEDEGEQGDTIEGVPEDVVDEQGECKRDRHRR